jgi:hypothetical protein
MVNASQKGPMDEEPTIYQGKKWVHNTVTRKSVLSGSARVILPQSKTQKKPDDATKPDGDKKPDDKKATDKKPEGDKKTDGKDK